MRRGLESRVQALEGSKPAEAEVYKALVPEWLLHAWQEQGFRFDPFADDSIRQGIRAAVGPRPTPLKPK